jgi:hypothetical protein
MSGESRTVWLILMKSRVLNRTEMHRICQICMRERKLMGFTQGLDALLKYIKSFILRFQ